MKKTKQFLRWHWPLFLGLLLFTSLKTFSQSACSYTTCYPFTNLDNYQIYGAIKGIGTSTAATPFKDNSADTLNNRLKLIKDYLFYSDKSVGYWTGKTFEAIDNTLIPNSNILQASVDTLNQSFRTIIKNQLGGNNMDGGKFQFSTASFSFTTNTQLGATIPVGYKLCITSINFFNTGGVNSAIATLWDGNTTNLLTSLSGVRTNTVYATTPLNYDPAVPLELTPGNSLFCRSTIGTTLLSISIVGYISKL